MPEYNYDEWVKHESKPLPEYFKDWKNWTVKKYKITYLWKSVTLEATSESKALQKAKELLGFLNHDNVEITELN